MPLLLIVAAAPAHRACLDGLRAVAALYVLLHHAFRQVVPTGVPSSVFLPGWLRVFNHGHLAVDVFIVLSGFCLMLPVISKEYALSGGALRFYGRRAWRILPPYVTATGLSLLLIWLLIGEKTGTHWDVSLPVAPKDVVAHALLVQDLWSDSAPRINYALWSISVEWRIYLLFPFLVLWWKQHGAVKTTAFILVLALMLDIGFRALHLWFPSLNTHPAGACPHYLGLFGLGMFAADMTHARGNSMASLKVPWALCLLAMTLLVCSVVMLTERFPRLPFEVADLAVGLWTMCLLAACAAPFGPAAGCAWLARLLSAKPLVFIGSFAYSIYLIHAPLLQVVWQYALLPLRLGPAWTLAALTMAGAAAIVAVSYGFFLLAERPFLSRRAKAS